MSTAWSRRRKTNASWDAVVGAGRGGGGVEQFSSGPSAYNPPSNATTNVPSSLNAPPPPTPPSSSAASSSAAAAAAAAAAASSSSTPTPTPSSAALNPYQTSIGNNGNPTAPSHSHSHGSAGHGHSHGGSGIQTMERDLFVACGSGNLPLVQRLVSMGGDVQSFDAKGATPLHWAALNNQTEVAAYLLSEGADPDAPNSVSLQTPLHWAAIHGYLDTIKLLLDEGGAALGKTDAQGFNALHHAVQYGQTLCAHFLLERGLDLDCRDDAQHTPLLWASYRGHGETVSYLLRRGANIRAQDDTGCSALHWAALKNHIDVAKILIKAGAPLDLRDDSDCTPEACAVEKNHQAMAQYLNWVSVAGDSGESYIESSTRLDKILIYVGLALLFPVASYILASFSLMTGLVFLIPLVAGLVFQLRARMNNSNQDYAYLGILHGTSLLGYYLWFSVLFPLSPPSIFTSIAVLVLSVVAIYSYVKLVRSDPGFTPVATDFDSMLEEAASGRTSSSYCRHCKTRKPLRSEHCLKCNRCVAKYSHHCPWTTNCIGGQNQVAALVCLLSVTCLLVLFELSVLGAATGSPSSPSFYNIPGLLTHIYGISPPLFLIFLWAVLNTVWTVRLSYSSLRVLRTGLTIHEFLSHKPYLFSGPNGSYANPFNAGASLNLRRFFGLAPDQYDWLTLYDLPGGSSRSSSRSSGSMIV